MIISHSVLSWSYLRVYVLRCLMFSFQKQNMSPELKKEKAPEKWEQEEKEKEYYWPFSLSRMFLPWNASPD